MSTDNEYFHHKGVKVQRGDLVEVTLRGTVNRIGSNGIVTLDCGSQVLDPNKSSFAAVRVIQPPLKVGDMVRSKPIARLRFSQSSITLERGLILQLDPQSGQAWVRPIYSDSLLSTGSALTNLTYKLSELERIP